MSTQKAPAPTPVGQVQTWILHKFCWCQFPIAPGRVAMCGTPKVRAQVRDPRATDKCVVCLELVVCEKCEQVVPS